MTDAKLEGTGLRKLRLGVMGEFSAGKSTLCNLLLGARPLTERVTATRLSPVWISHGAPGLEREFLDGTREALAPGDLESVPIKDTRAIRLHAEAEALEMFDLIDFPGISDPNMPTEVWERLIPELDAVLWCTHANQAWRQSEAEVWRSIPEDVKRRSLLLVTRFDTILSERDRGRVLARVRLETQGEFAEVFPISLTRALAGGEDPDAWQASGAEPFTDKLIELIAELQGELEEGLLPPRTPIYERTAASMASERYDGAAPEHRAKAASGREMATGTEPEQESDIPAERPSLRITPQPRAMTPAQMSAQATTVGGEDVAESGAPAQDTVAETVPEAAVAAGFEEDDAHADAPVRKAPISLLARRGSTPAATGAPSVMPRRVQPSGMRRSERPSGDAAVSAQRMDALKDELAKATSSPEALRDLMSRR